MKKIECYIRPERVEPLVEALKMAGAPGVTITEVRGFGIERVPDAYLRPKAKVEVILADREVEEILAVILDENRSGAVGDGKIVVSSVDEVYRIRTGERGVGAVI